MMRYAKILIPMVLSIIITQLGYTQNTGTITYQETLKLEIQMDDAPSGVDLAGLLPTSRTVNRILTFNDTESIYKEGESTGEDTEISSDDGSIQIKIMESDIESMFYTDHKNGLILDQQGFMGRAFVIKKEVEKIKWKITPEKVKYLDYECMKATMTDEEGESVVAWFAPAIPAQVGPSGYGQLPGAILMLTRGDQELEIKATNIDLGEIEKIKKPKNGKEVTEEEYEKIVEEKTKEMEKEYGGRSIMIRG